MTLGARTVNHATVPRARLPRNVDSIPWLARPGYVKKPQDSSTYARLKFLKVPLHAEHDQQRQAKTRGSQGPRDRRLEDDPPYRRDAAHQGRMRGVHRRGWIRRTLEDRRPSARHRLRRYHDAAPRWLSNLLPDQAQQGVPADSGDHALEQGRTVRPRPRPHRGLRALPDEAVHEG